MANQRGAFYSVAATTMAIVLALGCASTPQEVDLPPQTLTDAPTSTAQEEAQLVSRSAEPAAAEPDAAAGETAAPPTVDPAIDPETGRRRQTIVIQTQTTAEVTPQTLHEASTSERERRAAAVEPVAVITNSNLAEHAEGGQITILKPDAPGAGSTAAGGSASTVPGVAASAGGTVSAAQSEEYWRGQALKLRLDWKAAVENIDDLESEVQELRRRFYEEDDPFYRDNQIKPAWDRKLDLLAAAKVSAEEQERKVSRFLEEGRKAGALPGWLREGVEFEPPPSATHTQPERRRNDDPWEPKILDDSTPDP